MLIWIGYKSTMRREKVCMQIKIKMNKSPKPLQNKELNVMLCREIISSE